MFWDDTDKPMSRRELKTCLIIVAVGAIYFIAVFMTADKPAHKTEYKPGTVKCSQEVAA